MFALDEYGYPTIIGDLSEDENTNEIKYYLELGIGASCERANHIIARIKQVLDTKVESSTNGDVFLVEISPEVSRLIWLTGKLRDVEFEVKTVELLNYVISWRDFVLSAGDESTAQAE